MPIQSVEYWEEKAWLAEEAAKGMNTEAAKASMLEIAQLYRKLAEQTRKLKASGGTA
jgi:aminoglycoside phosphotransferase